MREMMHDFSKWLVLMVAGISRTSSTTNPNHKVAICWLTVFIGYKIYGYTMHPRPCFQVHSLQLGEITQLIHSKALDILDCLTAWAKNTWHNSYSIYCSTCFILNMVSWRHLFWELCAISLPEITSLLQVGRRQKKIQLHTETSSKDLIGIHWPNNPPLDWGEAPSTRVINLAPPNIADDVCLLAICLKSHCISTSFKLIVWSIYLQKLASLEVKTCGFSYTSSMENS